MKILWIWFIGSAGSHFLRLAHSCPNNRVSSTALPRQGEGPALPLTWPWANPLTYCKWWGARSHATTWQTSSEARCPHVHALRPAHLQGTMAPGFSNLPTANSLRKACGSLHLLSPNGTRWGCGFSAGNVLIGCFFIFLSIVYRISSWFIQLLLLLPIL